MQTCRYNLTCASFFRGLLYRFSSAHLERLIEQRDAEILRLELGDTTVERTGLGPSHDRQQNLDSACRSSGAHSEPLSSSSLVANDLLEKATELQVGGSCLML